RDPAAEIARITGVDGTSPGGNSAASEHYRAFRSGAVANDISDITAFCLRVRRRFRRDSTHAYPNRSRIARIGRAPKQGRVFATANRQVNRPVKGDAEGRSESRASRSEFEEGAGRTEGGDGHGEASG